MAPNQGKRVTTYPYTTHSYLLYYTSYPQCGTGYFLTPGEPYNLSY